MRIVQLFLLAGAFAACTSAPHPAPAAARASTPAATVAATVTPAAATAPATPSPSATAAVRYVAIGASDTVGVGASDPATGSWPARVAAFLPPGGAFVNLGVSGSVAAQAKDQQLPGAIAQRPSVVSVWLAVNDMNATIDPASYRSAIGAIVDALVARTEAKIFVGNVPDVRGVPAYKDTDKNALAAQIGAYNDAIASIVGRYPGRAFLVDLFTGSAPLVSTITVSSDGFHPSDEGYRLIAERFANTMRANGVPLRP
ncbi:MAG TPA: GDSL-type esterase/lipase family protein [Candidatus Limnocylindria bacterium]|nr:GDSL-type esterase/lipase family protein [Candidatus Limnocylindria bacterium]